MSSQANNDSIVLRKWFMTAIKERGIDYRNEPMSYECNTAYDYAYYRLQVEAREFWLKRYGYAPTDEMLSRAFFDAELERFDRLRSWRNPLAWLTAVLRRQAKHLIARNDES